MLEHYLRIYCEEKQGDWAKLLPLAEFAYNNSVNATTGVSPFRALYGFDPVIRYEGETSERVVRVPAAKNRIEAIAKLKDTLEKRWQSAVASQATAYNRRHEPIKFGTGDQVLLSTKDLNLKLPSKKLAPKFIGPFRVAEPVGSQAYRLHLPTHYRIHDVFNVARLEKYTGRPNQEDNYQAPIIIDDEEQ